MSLKKKTLKIKIWHQGGLNAVPRQLDHTLECLSHLLESKGHVMFSAWYHLTQAVIAF